MKDDLLVQQRVIDELAHCVAWVAVKRRNRKRGDD
jgi:cation transport regulator ChaB